MRAGAYMGALLLVGHVYNSVAMECCGELSGVMVGQLIRDRTKSVLLVTIRLGPVYWRCV